MTFADRYFLPSAFALAPSFLLLLTWPDEATHTSQIVKNHAAPVIAVEITVIAAALLAGWRPRFPLWPAIGLLALAAIALVTAYYAPLQQISLIWTAYWVIHFLFGAAAATMFCPKATIRALLVGFVIFLLLLTVRSLLGPVHDWERNPPAFDQVRRFGYYGAAVAGIGIGYLALSRRPILAFVAVCGAMALMFWTGARGAVIATVVGPVAAAIVFPVLRKPRIVVCTFAAGAAGLAVASILPSPVLSMGADRIVTLNEFSSTGRIELWQSVVAAIAAKPWFGWGEAQTLATGSILAQPHNLFLQVLLAWGAVGFLLVAYLGAVAARSAISNVGDANLLLPFAVGALTLLAYSMIDGPLFHVQATSIFALCVGLAVGGNGRENSMTATSNPSSPVSAAT